eukprot:378017_1
MSQKHVVEENSVDAIAYALDIDDEKTTLKSLDNSGSIKDTLTIKQQPPVSINTGFKCLDYAALITLNVLVAVWYDPTKFNRSDIFWAIFVVAYVSNLDGTQRYLIAEILFEISQYILYLWFCSWQQTPLIVFSILITVMFGSKLVIKLIYKFGVDIQTHLIHENCHRTTKEYKFYKPAQWFNGLEVAMLATTVPMFYFDQTRIWGSTWYTVIVALVLWYHRIMDIGTFLYIDIYVREWMNKMSDKYHRKFDKKSLEMELRRPVKEYEHQQVVEDIIPIGYNLLLFVMLLIYFIIYGKSEMTQFEYIYGIILFIIIGFAFVYWGYTTYLSETSKGDKTLEEILNTGKHDPELCDLFGTWIIDNDKHACESFTLKKENIMEIDMDEIHKLSEGCCSHDITDIYNSCVVGAIQLPLSESKLRNDKAPLYFKCIQPQGYKFILHKNGIIKFVPIGDSIMHKLMLARLDSQGWYDLLKNIKHANKYSCFCLGILTKDGKMERYNRWNSDLEYFYTAEKVVMNDEK